LRIKLAFLFLMLGLISACSRQATPAPDAATETPAATTSPTPSAPLVILIVPADMPQDESDRYQTLVYDLAQANGMRFQVRNSLTVEEVQMELPALKIVIAVPPDPGLEALTIAAPGVQFLSVSIPNLTPAANLSSIGSNGVPVDQQAFLAGYIAGMLASEWRVGLLTWKDTPDGNAAWTAFTNGFRFFCGYCRNPNFTQPSYDYPIIIRVPADASEGEYAAYAAVMREYQVKAVFVSPGLNTFDTMATLADDGILVISESDPEAGAGDYWVTGIQPDVLSAIQNIFPALVAGQGGISVPTPLYLADINPDQLSEAKQRLVQEVLDGLQNGTIGTGVTP
jgi:hypothetical protein